jgi:hypothetical protein
MQQKYRSRIPRARTRRVRDLLLRYPRKRGFQSLWLLFTLVFFLVPALSEPVNVSEIQKLIQSFKADPKGPYQEIRWFYPDGTTRPAGSPDPGKPGGIQHALHKNVVTQIQKEDGIYLGQILAGTKFEDLLDTPNQHSRMKQYQIEQYLRAVDNGWIFRRAQYYRGAFQAENEEDWGSQFLAWMLSKDEMVTSQLFICRQISQDIPHFSHSATRDQLKRIRALAKSIADELPAFADVRVKIHGQPDAQDVVRVGEFRSSHSATREQISPEIDKQLQELQKNLESIYREPGVQMLSSYTNQIPENLRTASQLKTLLQNESNLDIRARCSAIADVLWNIREELPSIKSGKTRLAMMDLSIGLEATLMRMVGTWKPETLGGLLEKNYTLARAVAGCCFIEAWEWRNLQPLLMPPTEDATLSLEKLIIMLDDSRRTVYWGTGMTRATYEATMNLFSRFEPLASGFIEDRIRASILLALGDTVAELSDLASQFSGISNHVLGIKNQNDIRGLNPGFAFGELEVVMGAPEEVSFSTKKIYALQRAPADIKPVAGVATVAEGNLVSHVQLLARNLGIPNAVLSLGNLRDLAPLSGQAVFYAVSPRGRVLMKPASDMTPQEKALVEVQKRKEERIRVPTDKLNLRRLELVSLLDLRASDSGRICGPKAANLGQLKSLFPDNVAPGFIIAFGIFRSAMDQPMPGTDGTFWRFLEETFAQAKQDRQRGKNEEEIENNILLRLSRLQEAIRNMPLPPELAQKLRTRFRDVLGGEMGQVPVFVRSDTNMEDLKEFTGAGLNLTVPNVVKEEDILQGIRDVWASPFRERGYRWRQKYLLNPENVYPSILLLKSADVDKSGVMITTGIVSSDPRDITVSFNWGVGGAVDGQVAESYLLRHDGADMLLSPAREPLFKRLSQQGGVENAAIGFEKPILSRQERDQLRQLDKEIRRRLPGTPGIESEGPYDVELGFLDGHIWLFQVRPFVESKNARSTAYLYEMDPELPKNVRISLTDKLAR